MHSSLRLRGRYMLHTMYARLVLQFWNKPIHPLFPICLLCTRRWFQGFHTVVQHCSLVDSGTWITIAQCHQPIYTRRRRLYLSASPTCNYFRRSVPSVVIRLSYVFIIQTVLFLKCYFPHVPYHVLPHHRHSP